MRLRDVLAGCPVLQATGDLQVEIAGLAYDSRRVASGSLFVAIQGLRADGNRFVPQALANGAAGIVSTAPRLEGVGAPWIQVSDDRTALAIVAANLYGRPTEKLYAIGVTGTNGKTTTTYLVESILKSAGFS